MRHYMSHLKTAFYVIVSSAALMSIACAPTSVRPARPAAAGGLTRAPATIPLTLFWHSKREENATVAAPESIRAQKVTGGYRRVRVEGCILADPQPGTR